MAAGHFLCSVLPFLMFITLVTADTNLLNVNITADLNISCIHLNHLQGNGSFESTLFMENSTDTYFCRASAVKNVTTIRAPEFVISFTKTGVNDSKRGSKEHSSSSKIHYKSHKRGGGYNEISCSGDTHQENVSLPMDARQKFGKMVEMDRSPSLATGLYSSYKCEFASYQYISTVIPAIYLSLGEWSYVVGPKRKKRGNHKGKGGGGASGLRMSCLDLHYLQTTITMNDTTIPASCEDGSPAIVTRIREITGQNQSDELIHLCPSKNNEYALMWRSFLSPHHHKKYLFDKSHYNLKFFEVFNGNLDKKLLCHVVSNKKNKKVIRKKRNIKGFPHPELIYTFIEQAVQPGAHISLKCSGTGDPTPRFDWLLDRQFLSTSPHRYSNSFRYSIGQFMDNSGVIVSHLNISGVKVEDGGLYECRASNSKGIVSHTARLNVYGPPYIRSISTIKGVTGGDVEILCPYYGYPISSVKWDSNHLKIASHPRFKQEHEILKITQLDPATDVGSYTCSVGSPNGELARRDIQLLVNSPPIISPLSFPPNLKAGERAQLSCTVTSGDMPVYFSWLKDGIPISSALQIEERSAEFFSYLLFKSLSASHSGIYTCLSTNAAGKVNSSTELIIKVPPYWSYEPQDVSSLLGSSIAINCDAKGYPEPRTYWSKQHNRVNDEFDSISPISGHLLLFNNGSLVINSISSQDEGSYRCTAENGVGTPLHKTISVSVNEPARFETTSQNITTRRNDPVTLVCDVLGDNPIHNVWTHNGNSIDTNKYEYRISLSELKKDKGLRSQLSIEKADRHDSGLYRCQASNSFGRSEHFIHLAVQERPDPPSHLEVVEVSSRSVKLAWKRPFDGNSPVLGYLVQYQPYSPSKPEVWDNANIVNITIATNGPQSISSLTGDTLEQGVVNGLFPDTTYSMRMLAVNQIESSSFTGTIVAKTQEEAPTEPPENVQVQSGEMGELIVSWEAPSRSSWNGPLIGYMVNWIETGDGETNNPPMSSIAKFATVKGANSNRFTITGLRQFTRYKVTVKAYNRASHGPPSIPIMALTREGVPTAPPQSVRCGPLSSQSLKIEWAPPPRSHHGGTLLGYKIIYKPITDVYAGDFVSGSEVKRTSSSETYLHALLKSTNYSIQVLAYTSAGDGIMSTAVYCITEEDVPGPPADIKAISLTATSILVSWLPPNKPNGKIIFYTLYYREAGKSGQPTTQLINAAEIASVATVGLGGAFEVRRLAEKGRYEFWLTANTGAGEGEATSLVTQSTTTRVPAKIASFGIIVRGSVGKSLLLGCMAVGNPTPRARWLKSNKAITHSNLYKVTAEGHLLIHNVDQAVSGNYTCSAKNLFGNDEITYSVICLMPPDPPILDILYTTAHSAQIQWRPSNNDGGTGILGYILSYKRADEMTQTIELTAEVTSYNVGSLKCGSKYTFQIAAFNKVGKGAYSPPNFVNTKGEAPKLPDDWEDLLWSNASTIILDARRSFTDIGNCPLLSLSAEWKRGGSGGWRAIGGSPSPLVLTELSPATWYEIRITAENHAGRSSALVKAATTTLTGALISPPSYYPMEPLQPHDLDGNQDNIFNLISIIFAIVAAISTLSVIYILIKKRNVLCNCSNQSIYGGDRQRSQSQASDEKTICAEQQNMRNCQHDYSTSPIKGHSDKLRRESAEMYEISPYATFQVGGPNRPVAASTLDHTLQFRTFGHIENDALPLQAPCKRHFTKSHRHNPSDDDKMDSGCELQPLRMRGRPRQCSGPSYCVPIPQQDLYQRESSTESNELSPPPDRARTPRHYGERSLHIHQGSSSHS